MKTLVITDVQRDFFHPEGSLYVAGGELLPAKILAVASGYDKVVITLDWHPGDHCSFAENGGPWPVHCVQYTQGAGLPDEFAPIIARGKEEVQFFHKGWDREREEYGAFDGLRYRPEYADIFEWFKASDEIHICGIAGDYCVKETARKILDHVPADKLKVLTDLICSIDDGTTLREFVEEYKLQTR